jgi:hypothetical protein
LLPASLRDWLAEDHLVWFVVEAVGQTDLSASSGAYRWDGCGRAAHDSARMANLFIGLSISSQDGRVRERAKRRRRWGAS